MGGAAFSQGMTSATRARSLPGKPAPPPGGVLPQQRKKLPAALRNKRPRSKEPAWPFQLLQKSKPLEVTTIRVAPPRPPPPPERQVSPIGFSHFPVRPFCAVEKDDLVAIELTSDEGTGDRLRAVEPERLVFPLHNAVSSHSVDHVRILVRTSADVNARNSDGATALHAASFIGHAGIVEALVESGASINCRAAADLSSPGHLAAQHDHTSSLLALLKAQAEVDAVDAVGATMLHYAAGNGSPQAVRALLNRRADCNVRNTGKRTPLHEAASCGDDKVVKMLISSGADPHAKDQLGQTPLSTALKGRKEKVALAVINGYSKKCGIRDDISLQENLESAREWMYDTGLF